MNFGHEPEQRIIQEITQEQWQAIEQRMELLEKKVGELATQLDKLLVQEIRKSRKGQSKP